MIVALCNGEIATPVSKRLVIMSSAFIDTHIINDSKLLAKGKEENALGAHAL